MRVAQDWARSAMADPQTHFLLARGTTHLMRIEPAGTIAVVDARYPGLASVDESQLVLLGWFRGRRCVLVDLSLDEQVTTPPGTRYEELRPLLPLLHEDEARLLAYCRALLVWRSRHRYCGVCGASTAPQSAGHVLACTRELCNATFFPRIDPAVIVLVTDGALALLGRQATWPAGRYSALAGFVEPGESLEEAVAREVEEETGVRTGVAHYYASQPWPFPASLMLGFHATATRGPLRLDQELEDARWFTSEELRSAPDGMLPPRHTIARRLIEEWLRRESRASA
jgi:NAD+ diphosphatase